MQKTIAIGLLLPSSTITSMSRDFEAGIKKGLQKVTEDPAWNVALFPEFIAQGAREHVETAINKLIGYNNADIITGIVSNRSGVEVAEKFERGNRPFLINNLGEHLPNPKQYNTNVFLNSMNLWQQVWALGHWGVQTFGKKGMFVSGLYDAGYSFSAMLQAGMQAADTTSTMPFAVAPVARPGQLADVSTVLPLIEQFNPDFVMAAFCGEEAVRFLTGYSDRGLHRSIPLLGLPFLLQPFAPAEPITVHTTIATNTKLESDSLSHNEIIATNPFPQLGYESGLLIAEALQAGGVKKLKEMLSVVSVASARGPLAIQAQQTGSNTHVYLVHNRYEAVTGLIDRQLGTMLKTTRIDSAAIEKTLNEVSSGWLNPYLGV